MISLDDDFFQPTSRRRYCTHIAHHCLHHAAGDPLPSFHKVGWRKLWRKSDIASTESIVRFLKETIVCFINAFKARSSAFESRQKLPRVYQSYRESSQHLWRHFLHYDIIPLKVPFRLTGHIYLGEERCGGALMHVYLWEHIVSPYYRTAVGQCKNRSRGCPLLQETSSSDLKATATNGMSNNAEIS